MIVEINVVDEISPMLQHWIERNPKYFRSLGKSIGWWYQREIKTEVREGHAGNVTYPQRWALKDRRKLNPKAPIKWYGRMLRAVGYQYDNGVVKIGWTSSTSARYGNLQEFGYNKVVTERMRKYFRSKGIGISDNTKQLNIPDRPIFEPMADDLFNQIAPYAEEKIKEYMQGNVEFGKKNRRKYKVYK